MALPDFPDSLPCVSRIDGFQMSSSAAVIRTPFEAGNSRQRRLHNRMPTEIALAWRVENARLAALFAWLNTFGYDWFNLRLAGLEASRLGAFALKVAVRCMSDIQVTLMQFHRSNYWTLRVTAEYQPPAHVLVPGSTGTWVVGGTPPAPSSDWVIAKTPPDPATDWVIGGTPPDPSGLV